MTEEFDNLIHVYTTFPFLEAFPFKEYKISLSKEHVSSMDENATNKLLYSEYDLQFEPLSLIHFTYPCDNSDVTISFYMDDIDFLNNKSDSILKLDSTLVEINKGLNNQDIIKKMKAIKHLFPFMKKVGTSEALKKDTFESVLKSIQSMSDINLSNKTVDQIKNLDENIDLSNLKSDEEKCVIIHLDFQLHHAKIILGTIIASKIYL
jgi:hypothetical protein